MTAILIDAQEIQMPTVPPSTKPPIVLIAQLGGGGDTWKAVVDRLDGHAVIAYDRPGTGNAPGRPAPNPPISHGVFARELANLLDDRGVTGPVILVGHSFGGLIARAFGGLWPQRVAGLVFVDASLPQFHLLPTGEAKRDGDGPDATEIDVVLGQVEILSHDLPDVPTVVMTRTPGTWSGEDPPPHPAVEDLWLICQQLLARETGAPLIVADNCGHQLPREVPELVALAITAVAEARPGELVALDEETLNRAGGHLDGR